MNIEKPINKLVDEFISEIDSKPATQKFNKWVLNRFVKWMVINKINVRSPRRADIIYYKNSLITEGKQPTTINTYLSPIRKFFEWLNQFGYYQDIAAGIRSPKDNRQFRKEYLNPEQIIKLLELIPTNTLTGLRNYAMINLMVCNGLRRIEILRLTVADLTAKKVIYIQRKGREYKEPIQLQPEVFEPIKNYLVARINYTNNEPLFANHSQHSTITLSPGMVSRIVKKYLIQIKDSNKLTAHSLRHSAAINLLKSGKTIYDVQQLLGHNSINTTQAYLKAIEAENRFNNPIARDLVTLYRNHKKITKNKQLTT